MKRLLQAFHSFFVPKEENNYHAKALHLKTLTTYLFLLLLTGLVLGKLHGQSGQVLGYATDINSGRLLELTNQKRVENGLSTLTYNDKLAAAASAKAQHMFSNNYWAHYAPDGTAPWSFILGAGYQYTYAGENLAKNFMFSSDVVDAWMNSPTHRENLLRPEYTDVGFAVVNGMLSGEETTLVVQMFGTPQTAQVQSQSTTAPAQKVLAQTAPTTIPTLIPTIAPTIATTLSPAQPVQNSFAPSTVLAREVNQPKFNLLPFYVNANYVFIAVFLIAILLDFYLASKFKIIRISGKNLAHFIFLAFMLIGLTIILKGTIL